MRGELERQEFSTQQRARTKGEWRPNDQNGSGCLSSYISYMPVRLEVLKAVRIATAIQLLPTYRELRASGLL